MADTTEIKQTTHADYVAWLRKLEKQGGSGVVNNIDARALGRIAHILELQSAIIRSMRTLNAEQAAVIKENGLRGKHGYISTINL